MKERRKKLTKRSFPSCATFAKSSLLPYSLLHLPFDTSLSSIMFGRPYNGMFAGQQGTPGFKALQILQGNASSGPPPNDPRLRWRPMMVEPWLDHVSTLNKDWHTFEQIPRVHPRAHLPHPLGTSSYPKIHMESLRDYSIRNNPPAPYEARMKVAVEDQMGWLRRYPKIPGDVLSDEQIANGCGKVSLL